MPEGREAETRWRALDRRRRTEILIKGSEPSSHEEAATTLGYARRMLERNTLMAVPGAVAAFVVWLGLALLVEGTLTGRDFVLAAFAGVAAGLGLGVGGRIRARRLASKAQAALQSSGDEPSN